MILGNIKKVSEILEIGGEYPASQTKRNWQFARKIR